VAGLTLRPYQEEAADFLYGHDRAMVLAPVGAGKTAATLVAMRDMLRDRRAWRFLILAPLRVATSVWPVEAAKWAPELRVAVACGTPNQRMAALYSGAPVVVANYDSLQWLAEQDLTSFDAVVFDELTRLKNPSGKRFKAFEKIVKIINVRWGLTGSFTSNGLEDVFGQVKIIDQRLLGRSKGAFQQQYFNSFLRGNYVEYEPRPGALEQVMARIKPATYVLQSGLYTNALPPLHTVEVPVEMDMRDYETMKKNFVLQFPDAEAIAQNAAVVTQKLQQLSAGFIYTGEDARWLSQHKLDQVESIWEENQRAPTIVWYQYVAEREALQRRFPRAVDVKADGAIEDWNAGRVPMLLAHPASAGHGLNLQHGGCRMIWLSLPWSLELYEQAVGRLHRSGQGQDVWCYVLQTVGTVDQKIWQALRDKRSLAVIALESLK
jgi:SNF2 family DNA or RNA helicase